jgi:hypothetical protein
MVKSSVRSTALNLLAVPTTSACLVRSEYAQADWQSSVRLLGLAFGAIWDVEPRLRNTTSAPPRLSAARHCGR